MRATDLPANPSCYKRIYGYIYITILVVVDSNVVYAGLYSNSGSSYLVLELVAHGKIKPALSIGLFEEYMDVLRRDPLAQDMTDKSREDYLDYFCSAAKLTEIFFLWRPCLKNPKDDLVLEAAVASGSETIITHNVKDFKGVDKFGLEAIKPIDYLRKRKLIQ